MEQINYDYEDVRNTCDTILDEWSLYRFLSPIRDRLGGGGTVWQIADITVRALIVSISANLRTLFDADPKVVPMYKYIAYDKNKYGHVVDKIHCIANNFTLHKNNQRKNRPIKPENRSIGEREIEEFLLNVIKPHARHNHYLDSWGKDTIANAMFDPNKMRQFAPTIDECLASLEHAKNSNEKHKVCDTNS